MASNSSVSTDSNGEARDSIVIISICLKASSDQKQLLQHSTFVVGKLTF